MGETAPDPHIERAGSGVRVMAVDEPSRGPGVRITGLRVRRGQRDVIDGLDLDAPAGTVTGLLGPNGAGKSTTIGALVGYLPASGGSIEYGDAPLARSDRVRFGLAPQEASLYPALSVWDNLKVYGAYAGIERRSRRSAMEQAVVTAQLEDHRRTRVGNLSVGMRRRLSLAIAMMGDPEVLVLDEPTAGVDPQARVHLLDSIEAYARRTHGVVIFCSHYLAEVDQICGYVNIIDGGRRLLAGTREELRSVARGVLQFRVAERDAARAIAVVAAIEPEVTEEHGLVTVVCDEPTAVLGRVADALSRSQVHLSDVAAFEASLDSLYFLATGTALRD